MKYRNRVRSRISNLKDPKNPNLRRNVLCGAILPGLIARMTAEVRRGARGPWPPRCLRASRVLVWCCRSRYMAQIPSPSCSLVPAPPAPWGPQMRSSEPPIGLQLLGDRSGDGGLVPPDGFERSEQDQRPAGMGRVMDHGALYPGLCQLGWQPPRRP